MRPDFFELARKAPLKNQCAFGNLALITVSGNSKFSNLPPSGKINSYPSVIQQSLKIKIMEKMMFLHGGKWDQKISETHKDEMFRVLGN
ncbi:hypothetical protein CSE16_13505 [Solibacillus sp. R5-41]|uniref:GmrSD restriction endonuclease domain-containing protein n=1 Tax=Solibacillus sp. R5-41 TaxID=2048654 RepID=UPI000C1245CB|nr:DUF1524 domain-containing protein [Solibacillus sp. R5-41]ATP40987.1 hypothetical protein CSE16_13505 [Solibacillus sp. R5-41]